jgi:hypothetical protein
MRKTVLFILFFIIFSVSINSTEYLVLQSEELIKCKIIDFKKNILQIKIKKDKEYVDKEYNIEKIILIYLDKDDYKKYYKKEKNFTSKQINEINIYRIKKAIKENYKQKSKYYTMFCGFIIPGIIHTSLGGIIPMAAVIYLGGDNFPTRQITQTEKNNYYMVLFSFLGIGLTNLISGIIFLITARINYHKYKIQLKKNRFTYNISIYSDSFTNLTKLNINLAFSYKY